MINEGNPVVFAKEWHSRNTGPGASTVLDTGVEVKKKDDRGWKIWGEGVIVAYNKCFTCQLFVEYNFINQNYFTGRKGVLLLTNFMELRDLDFTALQIYIRPIEIWILLSLNCKAKTLQAREVYLYINSGKLFSFKY